LITRILFGEQYKSWSSSLCTLLQSCCYLAGPCRPKYLPQHCSLKYLQHLFFPQCETPHHKWVIRLL
jgi:hypothetical protein